MTGAPEPDIRDIAWYGAAIERAANARSIYSMAHAIRDELGVPLFGGLPADTSTELKAVSWVFDYAVDFAGKKARLVPRVESYHQPDPPPINVVDENILQVWRDLLERVEAPPARARIAHALFQRGGSSGAEYARTALDNYIEAAQHWKHFPDADESLRAAARIARIIGENSRTQQALDLLLDAAQAALNNEPSEKPGYVIRPLDYLVNEADCPTRVDVLLEQAAMTLADVKDRDRVFELIFRRCTDEESKNSVWRRRVDNYLNAADGESGMMQMIHRHDALKVAEASKISELKSLAAAALQATRRADLELLRVKTSSILYQEHFDQVQAEMSAGDSWQEALVAFAKYGPLSGDYEQNRAGVENMARLAPLVALFPAQVIGPDGLPIYEATSPEDRFDADLVKWESQFIGGMLPPLSAALHSIPERFGIPDESAIAGFLTTWPSTTPYIIRAASLALQRFWCGDYEGAAYTAVPWIETAIRQLILDSNQGMYMLQRIRRPGQYPGLAAMIELLPGRFTLSHSRYRFLKATLTHPVGLNLRNQLSHGMALLNSSAAAALVLHTLLMVTLITPNPTETVDDETATEDAEPE